MDSPLIKIREVDSGDLDAILFLYSDLHENPVVPDEEDLRKAWNEILSDRRLHLFILECEGKPAATSILDIVPNLTWGARPYGLIENVVTKKEFRRKGLGSKLIEYTLNFAWENGCYKVMLLTGRKEEHVIKFYEDAGFIREGKKGLIALNPSNKINPYEN